MADPAVSRRRILWPAAIGTTVALVGAAFVLAFGISLATIARAIPYEWETTIGDQLTQAVSISNFECQSAPARAALQRLADRVAAAAGWDHKLHVHLVNSALPNAMTLPGGHIVVFRGLIDFAKSGDAVAGVLAHEVGHVVRRHSMEQMTRALGLAFVGSLATGGAGGAMLVGYAGQVWQLSYSRDDESDADRFAVTALQKAGLRNDGLIDFLRAVDAKHVAGEPPVSWLGTHPATPDRITALQDKTSAGGRSAFTAEEWNQLNVPCQSSAKFGEKPF